MKGNIITTDKPMLVVLINIEIHSILNLTFFLSPFTNVHNLTDEKKQPFFIKQLDFINFITNVYLVLTNPNAAPIRSRQILVIHMMAKSTDIFIVSYIHIRKINALQQHQQPIKGLKSQCRGRFKMAVSGNRSICACERITLLLRALSN